LDFFPEWAEQPQKSDAIRQRSVVDTLSLIKDGIRYGKISDGTFDITIGTLSDLWNFSEIAETAKSDENEVDASIKCSITDFSIPNTIFDQGEGIAADCHKLAVCLVNL